MDRGAVNSPSPQGERRSSRTHVYRPQTLEARHHRVVHDPLALAVLLVSLRAIGTLDPVILRPLLPLGFILMAASPWILLNRARRREIGLTRPLNGSILLPAVLLGAAAAFVCFLTGTALFGSGMDNWLVSVARNLAQTASPALSTAQLYLTFTIPAMIFSPVGEEIFFRGLLQRALEDRLPVRTSTWSECAFFGLVHLCHHGLIISLTGVSLLLRSAPLRSLLMTLMAYLFVWLRRRSRSLHPAIASHAAFNLTMGTCIFWALWPVRP
jgi:membrane protease YdiL (CAAX protease family)